LYDRVNNNAQSSFVIYAGANPEVVIKGLVNEDPNRYLYINCGKIYSVLKRPCIDKILQVSIEIAIKTCGDLKLVIDKDKFKTRMVENYIGIKMKRNRFELLKNEGKKITVI